MRPVGLVVPPSGGVPSGGHLYNQHLIQALQAIHPDQVLVCSMEQALALSPQELNARVWLIDTLYLSDLAKLGHRFPAPEYGLIVHHLESLEAHDSAQRKLVHQGQEAPIMQHMRCFLCTSPYTADYLQQLGYHHDQMLVIPPSLCVRPEPVRQKAHLDRVLMVANLVERKGVLPFLKALKEQTDSLPFVLEIAGSDAIEPEYALTLRQWLETNAKFARQVKLSGALNSAQIQAAYQEAQLFVSAARMETFGMALQEAVAYRLPILAHAGGNASFHLEEGERGRVLSSDRDLAAALLAVAADTDQLAQWQSAAWTYQPYQHYTWEAAAHKFASFFS